jgi:tetratricopeptide (TPR) repeat protein
MNLRTLLTRDPRKRAEEYLRAGKKGEAAQAFAKAGNFHQAAKLASELKDEGKLVEYSLLAALGKVPGGYEAANAQMAGVFLADQGHHREAIALLEQAGDLKGAAYSAFKLKQYQRAARLYEQAKAWSEAASCFEKADLPRDALRALEQEAKKLRGEAGRPGTTATSRLEEVNLRRADLLTRLGRDTDGADLLAGVAPSARAAKILEQAGRVDEAIQAYLELGDLEKAAALARKTPGHDRVLAEIALKSGRPAEAADLFARLGLVREAAEAYEAAGDWGRAAYRWEAAQEPLRAAEAYRKGGRARDAGRCFLAAKRPDLAVATYVEAGDYAKAAAFYIEAGQPLDAAELYLQAGRKSEACRVLAAVPVEDTRHVDAVVMLAPVLVEQGRSEEAIHLLHRLKAADGGRVKTGTVQALELLYWEGRALEGIGMPEAAHACYAKVSASDPTHRDVSLRSRRAATQPAAPGYGTAPAAPTATAPAPSEAGTVQIGQNLAGRYDILAEVGKGGMGMVYKALDRELGEVVAIKTLHSSGSEAEQERLLREVQICRKISHPNVVRVFDIGRFGGGIFITMELVEGERLDTFIGRDRRLELGQVKTLLAQIAAGLKEAHLLGIVHRDLKPSNLMVTAKGVKILDFGIARMEGIDARLTHTGFAMGSPMYMSPEQLQGINLDGRSDLYSLGIVTYALVAGEEPFHDANVTLLLLKQLRDDPPDLRTVRPELPDAWWDFIKKLLAKHPDHRYASAQEVIAAVAALPEA